MSLLIWLSLTHLIKLLQAEIRRAKILSARKECYLVTENSFNIKNDISLHDWIPGIYRVLKDGGRCYIFINSLNLKDMLVETEKAGFKLHNVLVWEKNN
nr:MAG TPA: METTL3/METTL14-adenosine methylation, METTL3-METTL14 complex, RNA [Caudoviricetes sp.]